MLFYVCVCVCVYTFSLSYVVLTEEEITVS